MHDPELAAWLIARRREIERAFVLRLGGATPRAAAPESEALRRFRIFAAASLEQGRAVAPSLDGLRADEARVGSLVRSWCEAAADVAGEAGCGVRTALAPLAARFTAALRATTPLRRASGEPRAARRAVAAAIDRVADVFLAIDTATAGIVDANPAAGSLLRTSRDALLEGDVLGYVPEVERPRWWTELEAISEGSEPRRFRTRLRDAAGEEIEVEASVTGFATRERTLALFVVRSI
ncbi:MAG TPA: PAS domain-containing protein [Myxococcota bacterium]|jgi:PAS domain-containing protein|nr:PAS domain-containing protein [Myxococcota bacterium]